MASTHLPGKPLLPICGMPMVMLTARRAARSRADLLVVTSVNRGDDPLAELLQKQGIRHVRGSPSDLLGNCVAATSELDGNDLCVLLSSDSVLPDGDLIQRLAEAANERGCAGLDVGSNGLSHGLCIEAVRVGLLRQADQLGPDPYDREHVTAWGIRQCRHNAPFTLPVEYLDGAPLHCVINTLDDYRNVAAALAGLPDPVAAPWRDLLQRLAGWLQRAKPFVPARIVAGELQASLVLGGAQLGLSYGIANRTGKPDDQELGAILDLAERHGISHLDTAAGYGDSERRIGSALAPNSSLHVITKLPPDLVDGQPSPREAAQRVEIAVDRSLQRLRRSTFGAVLLHRLEHYHYAEGAVWRTLLSLKDQGKIARIGASIYRPEELLDLLQDPDVGLVQIPFSILDQRWLVPEIQGAVAARPDVILHGRSALLQGLLTIDDPLRWPTPDRQIARRCIAGLKTAASALGRASVADLCFAYARAQPWLAAVVVGAETVGQMAENISLFRAPALTAEEAASALASLPHHLPEQLLNPALWAPQ